MKFHLVAYGRVGNDLRDFDLQFAALIQNVRQVKGALELIPGAHDAKMTEIDPPANANM